MEETLACRLCLSTSVKLYDMFNYRLNSAYETLTGVEMSASDGLPPYSCGVCSSLLVKSATFKRMCHNSYNLLNIAKLQQVLSTDYIKSLKITPLFSFTIKNTDIISIGVETDEVVKKEEDWEVQIDHKVKTESRESSIDSDRDEPISELFKRTRILVESLPRKVTRSKTEKTQRAKKTVLEKTKKVIKEKPSMKGVKEKKESKVKKEKVKKQKEKETGYEFPEGEVEVLMLSKEEQLEEIHARKSSVNYLSSFYKCELCFKGFISETTYKNHMVRHDPSSGALSCEICHIRVANNKLLRSHMIQLHERKYVCKLCNNVSKSKHSASEHSKWHSGQKFTCKFCDAVFSKKTSHLSHMRIHHPSEHVNCDVCGEAFIGEHGLRMHKKKAHKNMDTKTEPESETRCTNCKVQFQNADAFKRHTNNANGQCDVNFR
ncbi:zinc finger protein 652-like [Ostrinia furnacalis]|uniref:zinc finger protein 652-like n=1 Tax=Ostrinia furnacalis TaxID=93504 RepID=UPI00103C4D58|nr:zinc finger protein 652-like [Ostrinia furnacalis]